MDSYQQEMRRESMKAGITGFNGIYHFFFTPILYALAWVFYFIGIIMIYMEWFGVGACILINDLTLRFIWNVFDLFVFLGVYFIYHGVRQHI